MKKREGIKLRCGRWLFHIKLKRHGNATGVELYVGRLNDAHQENKGIIQQHRKWKRNVEEKP